MREIVEFPDCQVKRYIECARMLLYIV